MDVEFLVLSGVLGDDLLLGARGYQGAEGCFALGELADLLLVDLDCLQHVLTLLFQIVELLDGLSHSLNVKWVTFDCRC